MDIGDGPPSPVASALSATFGTRPGWRVGALLAIAAVAVLGVVTLGSKPIWIDEAYSAEAARLSLRRLFDVERVESDGLFAYYLLLKGLGGLARSDVGLRWPSLVAAAGAVPLGWAATRRLLGRAGAVIAAAVFALHPLLIQYGQEARPYALEVFASIGAVFLLRRCVAVDGLPARFAAWSLSGVVMILLHPTGALVIAAQLMALTAAVGWRGLLARWTGLVSGAVAAAAILGPVFILTTSGQAFTTPTVRIVAGVAAHIAGGTAVGAVPVAALLALGCVVLVRRGWAASTPADRLDALVWPSMLVVPPVLALVASPVLGAFAIRYFAVSTMPFAVVAVAALSALRPRARPVALAGLVVCLVAGQVAWLRSSSKDDWRAMATLVLGTAPATARPPGMVFVAPFSRIGFEHELLRRGPGASATVTPMLPSQPWGDAIRPKVHHERQDAERLGEALGGTDRVWFAIAYAEQDSTDGSATDGVVAPVITTTIEAAGLALSAVTQLDGIVLRRYDRPITP